jgi:hypothetical protein
MKRDDKPGDGLRITMQYRSKHGNVYELEKAGSTLAVHVLPCAPAGDSGDWLVEAQSSRAEDAVVIAERGATRAAALREVGRKWTESAQTRNLPLFDWNAVETVLHTVRAL